MRSSLFLAALAFVLGAGAVSACDGGSAAAPFSPIPSSLSRPEAGPPPSDAAADVALPTDARVDAEVPDAGDAGDAGEELDAAPDV